MPELLTHSRSACFKSCRRKHFYSYILGLRQKHSGKALRMGSAMHDAIEQLGNGRGLAAACDAVRGQYALCPDQFDQLEWYYEQETILRLACGYDWRWGEQKLEYLAVELPFELPLVNPATGKKTPNWNLAGKIDAIVRLEDGRLAVKETKLLGDDIGPESPLWKRMKIDSQVTLYVAAARKLGYAVECVLYDVARKPTIKPEQVPILDELGVKIVLDAKGERVKTKQGMWRTTGSTADGYVVQTKPQSPEEWGDKLTADIAERPTFYYSRIEIARLDQDIDEYQAELWEIQQVMWDAIKNNRHYRTVDKNGCGFCQYFDMCCLGTTPDKSSPPSGFYFLGDDKHPELKAKHEYNPSPTSETTPPTTTTIEFNGEQIELDSDPLPF